MTLDTKLEKIREWLSPPDPSVNYQNALRQRQPHTGQWFLDSDRYSKWKTEDGSTIWLWGIPGCGKTILSSTVIENIIQYCEGDPGRVTGYFFFDFNDKRKQDPDLMIRSLICQFSRHCVKVPTSLESVYTSYKKQQQQPTRDALLDVLQEIILRYPQSYIILDALDECENRMELLAIIEKITNWQRDNGKLHILVTSRKEREIQDSLESLLEKANIISLQNALVDDDIREYVRKKLLEDRNLRKWRNDIGVCNEIEVALMEGAQGMYV